MARQLVKFKPNESDATGQPMAVTAEDIAAGRILQLHWTKLNYGPIPPFAWLRRRGHWVEHLRALTADEIDAERIAAAGRRNEADMRAVVEAVRSAVLRGEKLSSSQLEDVGVFDTSGAAVTRQRIRGAVLRAVGGGRLRHVELPPGERRGARTQYLMAAEMAP
jgi:hypothetical protein